MRAQTSPPLSRSPARAGRLRPASRPPRARLGSTSTRSAPGRDGIVTSRWPMLAHAYLAVVRQHAIRGRGPRPRGRLAAPYGSRGAPAHLASRLGKAARSRSHPRLVELATPTPAARQTITLDPQNQNSSTPAVVLSSNSVVGQRMAVSFGIEFHHGVLDGAVEVFRSREGLMGEVMPLQVAPETLDVVQLRGVFRQPLDPEPVGALGERGAACLAGVDRTVVEDQNEGLDRDAELGPIAPVDLLQECDEVRASFGPAGAHDELAPGPVEHAEHGHFGALARGWNAQVGPFLGPDMRQVGRGEGFGLVRGQQHDVNRLGLRFEQRPAQARAVHGIRILAALQRVTGPSPAEIPCWRSTTDSREGEMRTPERVSISSARRGSVQFGRSATGADRTSSATAKAHSALTGAGPGATDVFSASTPPVMKVLRQKRTVSSRTPNASAIWPLVQPKRVSTIARARSASPRSRERLSAIRARLCSLVAATGDSYQPA